MQHRLENAPATLRRLFEGRNEGKQLLRVAEVVRRSKSGSHQRRSGLKRLKSPHASSSLRWLAVDFN